MAYLVEADLVAAMTRARVLACYDDSNDGIIDASALAAVLQRASDMVDGTVARSYSGPFPLATPNAQVKEAALLYAQAMSIERCPEYGARFGEANTLKMREYADKLCERIASGLVKLVDAPPPTAGVSLRGGIVFTDGPRLISTNSDGTSNTGDF